MKLKHVCGENDVQSVLPETTLPLLTDLSTTVTPSANSALHHWRYNVNNKVEEHSACDCSYEIYVANLKRENLNSDEQKMENLM